MPEGLTSIGERAFVLCDSLIDVAIPSAVTRIGTAAFAYCTGLIRVVIPEGVTQLGDFAFYECPGLREVIMPDSLVSIGADVFANTTNVTLLCSKASETRRYATDGSIRCQEKPIESETGEENIMSVTVIGDRIRAWKTAYFRVEIALDVSVLSISTDEGVELGQWNAEDSARMDSHVLLWYPEVIFDTTGYRRLLFQGKTENGWGIAVPLGLTVADPVVAPSHEDTGAGIVYLAELSPNQITLQLADTGALYYEISERINLDESEWYYIDSNHVKTTEEVLLATVTDPRKKLTFTRETGWHNLVIKAFYDPEIYLITSYVSLEGFDVRGMVSYLDIDPTPVILHAGDSYSFEYDYVSGTPGSLTRETFNMKVSSEESSRTKSRLYCVGGRYGTNRTAYFPLIILESGSVDTGDFIVNNGLLTTYRGSATNVLIPGDLNIHGIGSDAFQGLAVTSVSIPEGVTTISGSAFMSCEKLKAVILPDTVTMIGAKAFKGCASLEELRLPKHLMSITGNMFEGCSALQNITLLPEVTSISVEAFRNCTALTEVTSQGGLREIGRGLSLTVRICNPSACPKVW